MSGSEFSDRLTTMSAFFKIRQASTWPTIAREVGEGPDGSGHPSDWWGRGLRETHNQRKCIALWRACWRATSSSLITVRTEQKISTCTIIKASTVECPTNPYFLIMSHLYLYSRRIQHLLFELKSSAQVVFRPQCRAHPGSGLLRKSWAMPLAVWGVRKGGDKLMETGSTEGRHRNQALHRAAPWHLTTW